MTTVKTIQYLYSVINTYINKTSGTLEKCVKNNEFILEYRFKILTLRYHAIAKHSPNENIRS